MARNKGREAYNNNKPCHGRVYELRQAREEYSIIECPVRRKWSTVLYSIVSMVQYLYSNVHVCIVRSVSIRALTLLHCI